MDCGGAVILPQQRLADEKRVESGAAQTIDICPRPDTAFGDADCVRGHERAEAFGSGEIDVKVAKVAVVDADDPRTSLDGPRELALVMYFNERIATVGLEQGGELENPPAVQERREQQNRVRTRRDPAHDLGRLDHEVLHDHGQTSGLCAGDPLDAAFEELRLGNDGYGRSAAARVVGGDRLDLRVGDDLACRWRRCLDLGDDVHSVSSDRVAEGERFPLRGAFHRRAAHVFHFDRLPAQPLARALDDLIEDGHCRSPRGAGVPPATGRASCPGVSAPDETSGACERDARSPGSLVTSTSCCNFSRAAPLVIAFRASSTPSRIEAASPATYSAAPALAMTTSARAPISPSRILRAISALVFASPPVSSSIACIRSPISSGVTSYDRTCPPATSHTRVGAETEISSNPSRLCTTSACSAPSAASTFATVSTRRSA